MIENNEVVLSPAEEAAQRTERQAREPRPPDGAQVCPAPLDQQRIAELDRGVATAGLHQSGVGSDQPGEVDELIEIVGLSGGSTAPTISIAGGLRVIGHAR